MTAHSLPLDLIDVDTRTHRRLLTETSPGHYDLCIDNSVLEKMLTCPRAFELYAVYGRDQGERDALNYGSAIHSALEYFYKNVRGTDDLRTLLPGMVEELRRCFTARPCSENAWRNFDHALTAVERYVQWRTQFADRWEPIVWNDAPMVEVGFRHKLLVYEVKGHEWVEYPESLIAKKHPESEYRMTANMQTITVYWTGKIDLVRLDSNGKPRPVDHKTTSIGGPTFWSAFHLSSQMLGYTWATQKLLGTRVEGVDIDCLTGRPPTLKGKGLTHENTWQPFDYTQGQLDDWERDTKAHALLLIDRLLTGYFPKATAWCMGKYGACPYFDVCKQPDHEAGARILMSGAYCDTSWNPLNKPA